MTEEHHRFLGRYVDDTYIGIPTTQLYKLKTDQLAALEGILETLSREGVREGSLVENSDNPVRGIVIESMRDGKTLEQIRADPRLVNVSARTIGGYAAHFNMGTYNEG